MGREPLNTKTSKPKFSPARPSPVSTIIGTSPVEGFDASFFQEWNPFAVTQVGIGFEFNERSRGIVFQTVIAVKETIWKLIPRINTAHQVEL